MGAKVLGPLVQGSPDPVQFSIEGFQGGLNVYDPPQEVGDNDLTIATDGYLIATGSGQAGFQMRNGMGSWNSNKTASSSLVLARFYQDIIGGSQQAPEKVFLLGQIGNTLYKIAKGSAAFTSVGAINSSTNANPMTFTQVQNPNPQYYATYPAASLTDCMVICTGSGGPYVYDGTHLYTPSGWAAAAGASWCAMVNSILWFGGIDSAPNQIFGCGDGITASFESLPAYRNFVLTSPVTGMCAQGTGANAALVVGCNIGISVLYGTGPSTFYRQDIPFQDGVSAGRTMVPNNGIAYFLGNNGIYAFNGTSTPTVISNKVQPWILNDPFHQSSTDWPMTQSRTLSWAQVYNNRMFFGYCSNATTPNVILCYDLNVGGWTLLRPANGVMSMIMLNAPSDADPSIPLVGTSTTAQAMQWDFVPTVASSPTYDDAPTNTVAVLAQCQTKDFEISLPAVNKMLTRYYPMLFIAGPVVLSLVCNVDCGNTTSQALVDSLSYTTGGSLTWDVGNWDQATWYGISGLLRFGPPYSRADFALEFRELAIGMQNLTAQPVWMFTGGSGVMQVRGLT